MRAMVLNKAGEALKLNEVEKPIPDDQQLLIKVHACGICRTDLHILDGELDKARYPIIPGHQIIGTVESIGSKVGAFAVGDRVGVPWLGSSCGRCDYCTNQQENLCDTPGFTGYQINGGFAEYCTANAGFCFSIPKQYPGTQAAPLLCAGLIGYRCFKKAGSTRRLGIYGFGAAAHILVQLANNQGIEVYAFVRPGDEQAKDFAKSAGASWAGEAGEQPEQLLDAAIIFAPVGELVPMALRVIRKGGRVVCGGIHMSDLPGFPYSILWGERSIHSVANLTRRDGEEFLSLAPQVPINTKVSVYSLEQANQALDDLRHGRFSGAAVIKI